MMPPGLFRLLLASIVVLSHFSKLAIGTMSVELFFSLSGYWIYRMYDAKYRLAKLSGPLFIASRLLRLLPAFLLFNTAAILLHLVWHDRIAASLNGWPLLPNILLLGYAGLAERPMIPGWSLDIELQFYLAFPLLFPFLRHSPRFAWFLCLLLLMLGGGYMAIWLQDNSTTALPFGGFFLLGIAAAQSRTGPSRQLVRVCAALALIGFVAVLANPSWRGTALHSINAGEFAWNTGLNFLLAILLAPLALATVFRRSSRFDRLLGDLSYMVYCSHWIGVLLAQKYLSDESRWVKAPSIAGILIVTYAVSAAVLLYFDRPISRRRERWIGGFVSRPARELEVTAAP